MSKETIERPPEALTWKKAALASLLGLLLFFGFMAGRTERAEISPANSASNILLTEHASCRMVLTPLGGDKPIDNEITRLQGRIAASGSAFTAELDRLGWAFVKKARLTFDTGYYKLAEQCAACIEESSPNTADARLLRAHVLQNLHRFNEAEEIARQLVELRQRPFDYGVLGDALIDRGKVREGAEAYQKMVDLRPDLQSYVRAAHVRWLTGDLPGAIFLTKLACDSSSPNDSESAAWVFTRLAFYQLQQGAAKQALHSCDVALTLENDYAPALFARARILLALKSPSEALASFDRAAKLNPLPEFQWAVADMLRSTGDSTAASRLETQLSKATEDPRTLSLYFATRHENIELAVRLAKEELKKRQDIFTYDALAWALAVAGSTTEAQENMNHALAEGTQDARLFFHAGVIAALNNQRKKAMEWFEKAHAIRQMLLPSEGIQLEAWRKRTIKTEI